jgi:hypothetical protein
MVLSPNSPLLCSLLSLPPGYHIGFDREYMIEPIWLPEKRDPHGPGQLQGEGEDGGEELSLYQWPSKYDNSDIYYETCFRLQLDDKNKKNILKLTQNLTDACDENLLLFLNKLERMIYEDQIQKKKLELSKIKLSLNWYRLLSKYDFRHGHGHGGGGQSSQVKEVYWCTVRKVLRSETGGIMRGKNQKVESTEIAIALKFILDKGEGEEGDHVSLFLDTSSKLPIYAYLPTKADPYRFILQGDFLLSTSRESLLQDNDWNHYLFAHFPDLFLILFSELSELAWNFPDCEDFSEIAEICPIHAEVLQSSSSHKISLHITPQDLLNLIPRVTDSHSSNLFLEFANSVTTELKKMKFLRNSLNEPIAPSQFVNISSLHFHPITFISEDFLIQATGLHFIPSSFPSSLPYPSSSSALAPLFFTEDLLQQLSIPQFDVNVILKCFDFFSQHFHEIRAISEKNYWKIFSGLLLCLCEIISPTSTGTGGTVRTTEPGGTVVRPGGAGAAKSNRVVPSQVVRKGGGGRAAHQTSIFSSGLGLLLPKATVTKLQKLPIWPTTRQTYVAANNPEELIFFRAAASAGGAAGGGGSLTSLQLKCLKVFEEEYLILLDTDPLFKAANELHPKGMKILSEMFSKNFKSGGGIEELTPQIIIRKVILPSYARYDPEDATTHLSREIASSFLGFLYSTPGIGPTGGSGTGSGIGIGIGMEISKELVTHGVIVPTLCAQDYKPAKSQARVRWQTPTNLLVKINKSLEDHITDEVHLGLEVPSYTQALAQLQISTALRQLKWLILDPMVSILLFHDISIATLPATFETEIPYTLSNPGIIQTWTQFLLTKVGLVNFFGVYRSRNPTLNDCTAPSLMSFLHHLTRNRHIVYTDREEWLAAKETAEQGLDEPHDGDGDREGDGQGDCYCPHFLPSGHNKYLHSVSSDVHRSLQVRLPPLPPSPPFPSLWFILAEDCCLCYRRNPIPEGPFWISAPQRAQHSPMVPSGVTWHLQSHQVAG